MIKEKKRDKSGVVKSNIGGYQSDVDWIHREGKRKAKKKLQNVLLKKCFAEFVFRVAEHRIGRERRMVRLTFQCLKYGSIELGKLKLLLKF